ncbi:TrbC/VIRB2 family protein [compost metagenome]
MIKIKNTILKLVFAVMLTMVLFVNYTSVQAALADEQKGIEYARPAEGTGANGSVEDIDNSSNTDFWGKASSWFSGGKKDINNTLPSSALAIISTLEDMLNLVGTTVFVVVTIFLGVKYIYGSVDSKADIKQSMTTLLVAAVFFFGWTSIRNIIYPSNSFIFTSGTTSFGDIVGNIYSIAIYIANFLAIGGIVYIGVKYMLSGASGKADLKSKSMQFVLGIIMAFAAVNFLTYLSKVINQVF